MVKVKGKLVSGGSKVRIGGNTYSVEGLGKGRTRNMAEIRKNNGEVEVTLVPDKLVDAGNRNSNPQILARLDRKFIKSNVQIS